MWRTGASMLAIAAIWTGHWPTPVNAQEQPRVTVRVRQVAGNTVYLDIGTRHGLATGDTVGVALDSLGAPSGELVVTASTETRSVLTFIGAGLPVRGGSHLTLLLLRKPEEAPPPEPEAPSASTRSARPPRLGNAAGNTSVERAHGRVGLELSATRSATTSGGLDPTTLTRTFATPGLRLDATVPDAVAGFRLRTNMRVAYRYSSGDIISPAASIRVYSAVLERDFKQAPVRLALGRFLSPVESYSGFWDGMFLRLGGDDLGVGAIVGFEPDLWNERPSTALPKATAFLDGQMRGGSWTWRGNVSAHALRPRDSVPDHTFIGVSQQVSSRVLYLSQDLQVDVDPAGGWRVTRLQVRASVSAGAGFRLRAGASRRESWLPWSLGEPFAPRSDRVDAGLAYYGSWGGLSADGSVNRDDAGRKSWGATAGYFLLRLPGAQRLGMSGTVTRWSGPYGTSLSASPGLTLALTPAWLRLGYQYIRSDYLQRTLTSNAVDGSLEVPVGVGMRMSLRGRVAWGEALTSQSLFVTLYKMF
jgi:hypothetical protein